MSDKLNQPLNNLGGCNYRNYKLKAEQGVLRFVPTTQAKSLLLVLGFCVAAFFVFVPVMIFMQGADLSSLMSVGAAVYLLSLFGFIWISRLIWQKSRAPVCFDKSRDKFYSGNTPDDESQRLSHLTRVQVIRKSVRAESRNYYSYELNVVRKDGKRFKVMDHGAHQFLKPEAEQLAQFLNIEYDYIDSTKA